MKIVEKIMAKQADLRNAPSVTIACLGDSVTQGCFGLYLKNDRSLETYFDQHAVYHRDLAKILSLLYPSVPFNIINAGISGDNAPGGVQRLEQDVLCHRPDLVTVCYGLNDVCCGMEGLENYRKNLKTIFETLKKRQIETVFMTPNMMCTGVSCHLDGPEMREFAARIAALQNDGTMDRYMDAARQLCAEYGIPVCDCYAKWQLLQRSGVETDDLLANGINHPREQMHWLFAMSLLETLLS